MSRVTLFAMAFAGLISLGCSGVGSSADCVTDGGGIERPPRESPFSAGGQTIVVSEKYCMDFNDYSFKETAIAIQSTAQGSRPTRVVHCKRIRIDTISKRAPGVTAFESSKHTKPLLYVEAKGVFKNKDAWNCDF